MSTIITRNELVKRAMAFIVERLVDGEKSVAALIEEAAIRFNLGPKDTEYLERTFYKNRSGYP